MPISIKLLRELLDSGKLPLSRWSRAALGELRTPLDAGLLRKHRHGAGEILEVVSAPEFRAWVLNQFPGILGGTAGVGPRSANVGLARNSKRGARGLGVYTVRIRAHRIPAQASPQAREAIASLVDSTGRLGGSSLLLELPAGGGPATGPALPEGVRVMTIENQETFNHSGQLAAHADLFLQAGTGGRMRKEFILWLAAQPTLQVIHYGDFDPVGLQEFTLLLAAMPERVELFLPEGIEERIQTFCNRGLLDSQGSRAILAGLPRGLHPALDRVLRLIARHGPLEQEAFLVQMAERNAADRQNPE